MGRGRRKRREVIDIGIAFTIVTSKGVIGHFNFSYADKTKEESYAETNKKGKFMLYTGKLKGGTYNASRYPETLTRI